MSTLFQSSEESSTFPCPNCREFIVAGSTECRYCSASIDLNTANVAADVQARVNKACDEASLIRNMMTVGWVFFFARLIPFIGFIANGAMVACFLIVAVWLTYWQVKFGQIATADPDYRTAKRNWFITLGLWLLMLVIWVLFVLIQVVYFLLRSQSR